MPRRCSCSPTTRLAWRRRSELPPDLPAFRERLAEHGIGPLAIHARYLVNLAGADERFHQQSIATMVSELKARSAYGARFVNVHIDRTAGWDAREAWGEWSRAST